MKYHIERGFLPAAPHSNFTLCGININSTTQLCHYDVPPIGVRRTDFYIWINSRHMMDVDEEIVCKTCARIARGGDK
jgi:hypothetical protein